MENISLRAKSPIYLYRIYQTLRGDENSNHMLLVQEPGVNPDRCNAQSILLLNHLQRFCHATINFVASAEAASYKVMVD